jgi:uncharacterized Zn finger protein
MTNEDTVIVVCGLFGPNERMIPHSILLHCQNCGAGVSVAPTSQQLLAENSTNSMVLCMTCGMKHLEETGTPVQPPTAEQITEAMAVLKDE